MVNQSKLVKKIQGKIQSLLILVNLGLRKYVLVLLDLEQKLAEALSSQLKSKSQIVKEILNNLKNDGYEGRLWEKGDFSRIYVNHWNGRRSNGYGFINLDGFVVECKGGSSAELSAKHAVAAALGIDFKEVKFV